jgi:hypothetical protein
MNSSGSRQRNSSGSRQMNSSGSRHEHSSGIFNRTALTNCDTRLRTRTVRQIALSLRYSTGKEQTIHAATVYADWIWLFDVGQHSIRDYFPCGR